MSIYLPPSTRHFEPKWSKMSAWIDHVPFGYDLIEAIRPKLLVELGTHKGVSYFTFCQSIKDHDIDTTCYAVDTWEGDDHATLTEAYAKSDYQMVHRHNQQHYRGFSYLMRMLFSEALKTFADDSIDLLHIDGYHTYEAVTDDFNNWYPKVKPGGIILLHDIVARISSNFGVWKFWEEISDKYDSFAFANGFGLGVIRKPGKSVAKGELLDLMFDSKKAEEKEKLRAFYVHVAKKIDLQRHARFIELTREKSILNRAVDFLKLKKT